MKTSEISTIDQVPVRDENVLQLPLGLLGFEQFKRYVLLSRPEEAPFLWLQVLDQPNLAFVVVSPTAVAADYEPEISDEDVRFLDLRAPEDALVFNLVTLRGQNNATVNLKGPVLVNRRTLIGKQIVPLNAAELPVCQPISVTA
ncbi:MAG: flagellar assembly protein FliW [Verrucomicrobia bacterium]|nr:flagellar assembly protein FliW [Verrucomicrobiota bacterium]